MPELGDKMLPWEVVVSHEARQGPASLGCGVSTLQCSRSPVMVVGWSEKASGWSSHLNRILMGGEGKSVLKDSGTIFLKLEHKEHVRYRMAMPRRGRVGRNSSWRAVGG